MTAEVFAPVASNISGDDTPNIVSDFPLDWVGTVASTQPTPAVLPAQPQILPNTLEDIGSFVKKVDSGTAMLFREVLETIILTAAIFLLVNLFTGRFKIDGSSMDNTFAHGQYIMLGRLDYRLVSPERGDVIVFVPPNYPEGTFWERLTGKTSETDYIKRIIGKPGDTVVVQNGQVLVNGVIINEPYIREPMQAYYNGTWQLTQDQYFVMGDNRNASSDSRAFGPITKERIVGRVWVIYFPLSDIKLVQHYRHPELQGLQPLPTGTPAIPTLDPFTITPAEPVP